MTWYAAVPPWTAVDSLVARWAFQSALNRAIFYVSAVETFGRRPESISFHASSQNKSTSTWSSFISWQRKRVRQFRFRVLSFFLRAEPVDVLNLVDRYAKPEGTLRQLLLGSVRSLVNMGSVWFLFRFLPHNEFSSSIGRILWGNTYQKVPASLEGQRDRINRFLLLDSFIVTCLVPKSLHGLLAVGQMTKPIGNVSHVAENLTQRDLHDYFVKGTLMEVIWETFFFVSRFAVFKFRSWKVASSSKKGQVLPKAPSSLQFVGRLIAILIKYHYAAARLETFVTVRDAIMKLITGRISTIQAANPEGAQRLQIVLQLFVACLPALGAGFMVAGLVQYNFTEWCTIWSVRACTSIVTRDLPFPHPGPTVLASLDDAQNHSEYQQRVGLLRSVHWCHLRSFSGCSLRELELIRQAIVLRVRSEMGAYSSSFSLTCTDSSSDIPITNDAVVHAMLHCFKINNFSSRVSQYRKEVLGFEEELEQHIDKACIDTISGRENLRQQFTEEHEKVFSRSDIIKRPLDFRQEVFDFNPRRLETNDDEVLRRHCGSCEKHPYHQNETGEPVESRAVLKALACGHYVCEECSELYLLDGCPRCGAALELVPDSELEVMKERAAHTASNLIDMWKDNKCAFLPDNLRYCPLSETIDFLLAECEKHCQAGDQDDESREVFTARLGDSGAGSPFELITVAVPREYKPSLFYTMAHVHRPSVVFCSTTRCDIVSRLLNHLGVDPL